MALGHQEPCVRHPPGPRPDPVQKTEQLRLSPISGARDAGGVAGVRANQGIGRGKREGGAVTSCPPTRERLLGDPDQSLSLSLS